MSLSFPTFHLSHGPVLSFVLGSKLAKSLYDTAFGLRCWLVLSVVRLSKVSKRLLRVNIRGEVLRAIHCTERQGNGPFIILIYALHDHSVSVALPTAETTNKQRSLQNGEKLTTTTCSQTHNSSRSHEMISNQVQNMTKQQYTCTMCHRRILATLDLSLIHI